MSAPVTITRADIKAGDKIRVEYREASKEAHFEMNRVFAREFFAKRDADALGSSLGPEVLTLLDRPTPPIALKTKPGTIYKVTTEGGNRTWLLWRARLDWDGIDYMGEAFTRIENPLAYIRDQGFTIGTVVEMRAEAEVATEVLAAIKDEFATSGASFDADVYTVATKYGVTL